jgi:hypothetical protein
VFIKHPNKTNNGNVHNSNGFSWQLKALEAAARFEIWFTNITID